MWRREPGKEQENTTASRAKAHVGMSRAHLRARKEAHMAGEITAEENGGK